MKKILICLTFTGCIVSEQCKELGAKEALSTLASKGYALCAMERSRSSGKVDTILITCPIGFFPNVILDTSRAINKRIEF